MQIPVLIEPVAGTGYRARGGEPFAMTVEGATEQEALENLRTAISGRMGAGARIVSLEVSSPQPPWAAFAGTLRDDPLLDRWKEAMAEYRRTREEPEVP